MSRDTQLAGQGRRSLAGLSEERLLDALMAAVRAMALDDGVPARIARRGYGQFSIEVLIQDYDIVKLEVGSRGSLKA